jgi:hypothetical protein
MTLFDDGDRRLDLHDFAGAVDAYRSGMMAAEPSARVLGNLGIAEEAATIQFRRELVTLHDRSLAVRMALAHSLIASRKYVQAIECCTLAFEQTTVDARTEILLHSLRLDAALPGCVYDVAALDFLFVWEANETVPATHAFRGRLLSVVCSLKEPGAIEFLDGVSDRLQTGPVARLIEAKRAELRALGDALKELER